MFHRFHDLKGGPGPQDPEMMQDVSRSSTPGTAVEGRTMFSHGSSLPVTQHHSLPPASYPNISSPSPGLMTQSAQLMAFTQHNMMFPGSKYMSSTPPEAHRYLAASDTYARLAAETLDQNRYSIETQRISIETQRISPLDSQRMSAFDSQRMSAIDSQRMPTIDSQRMSAIDAQRMTAIDSQRMSALDAQRMSAIDSQRMSSFDNQRIEVDSQRSTPYDNQRSIDNQRSLYDSQRMSSLDNQRLPSIDNQRNPTIDTYRMSSIDDRMSSLDDRMSSIDDRMSSIDDRMSSIDDQRVSSIDSYRMSSVDQRISSVTNHRIANESYRQSSEPRIPTELERHSDEHSIDPYHQHSPSDPYHNPLDLQRVQESNYSQIASNAHRLVDSLQRLQADPQRLVSEVLRPAVTDSVRSTDSPYHSQMPPEPVRPPSEPPYQPIQQRPLQEPFRTHADAQRMVQESLRDYFSPAQRNVPDEHRLTPEQKVMPENLRYTPENMHSDPLRYDSAHVHQRDMMAENLRVGAQTPQHHMMPENLRVTSESSRMVPENLCVTEPNHQIMPENLRIDSSHTSGSCSDLRMNPPPSESPMPSSMRSHYDSVPHRMMTESPHPHMLDQRSVESPRYSETMYRGDMMQSNNMMHQGPPTPAPSVPLSMPDPSTTPHTPQTQLPQYYSGGSSYNHQFNQYMDSRVDNIRHADGMMMEDDIDIDPYNDVKPFIGQDFPPPPPPMSLQHENHHLPDIKPPKPKKPKEPKPPRVPVVHRCNECDKVFKNSTQLKNHMWRHTGNKPFACEVCGSRFTQQGNLRAHRRIHTGERPYQCPVCKACFTQLSTLKTHQKIHSDERPYKCDKCEAAFRQIANLKTHMVTHTGERPHKCDLCDKAFTQKSNLKAHKNRVHAGDGTGSSRRGRKKNPAAIKPFSCLECGAKFTMMSNLRIHQKLHSGERPHECDHCGAGFAQRSNLKTHVQRMHGKTPGVHRRRIRCDECPATFRLKRCLKTHKKKRHPIKSLKIKILNESKYEMEKGEDGEGQLDEGADEEDTEGMGEEEEDIGEEEEEDDEDDDDDECDEEEEQEEDGGGDETGERPNLEPICQISVPKEEPLDPPPSPGDPPHSGYFEEEVKGVQQGLCKTEVYDFDDDGDQQKQQQQSISGNTGYTSDVKSRDDIKYAAASVAQEKLAKASAGNSDSGVQSTIGAESKALPQESSELS